MRGCTKLMTLHLGNNQLQGEIPAEIGSSLKNLINLYLTRNRLSGEIPQSLAELPSLELLSLSHNKLSGEVPSALSNLTNLLNIRFSNNMLSGVIPSSLGMLPNLYELSLGFNNLSGPIPTSIWNISSLRVLSVQGNMLSGTIPANAFETLPHLEELYMDHNHLHGKIPVSLGNSSNMSMIILGANLFNGIVPQEIGRLRKLEQLVLTQTLVGAKEQKDWEFITALANCSQLQVLVLRMCEFGGVLPNSLSSLSTSLKYLSLSYNNISGSIPKDIGNLFNLQVLDLAWNSFTGTLPSSLGRLKNLHYFNVYNNDLGGPIPSTIGNLTGLITLYLMSNTFSGRLTNSLANLTKLTELDLSSNNFIGPIPSGLFNITTLSIALELSYNKFEGSIPQEIGNLVNLVKFNAESNKLSGEIPSTLGQCQNLQDLTLQNNMLNGNIPEQLSQLKSLQTLDFSRNNLSGEIPKFIENFTMLSYLNLSFNMFTGEVPINYCRPLIAIHTFCLAQEDPNRNPFNYIHARPSSGSGSFGSVYKGELDAQIGESPYYVAVKVLKLQTSGVFKSFAAECNALRNLRHRNLVKIITACSSIDNSGNDFKAIVFDFMPNGSLEGWLHPDKDDQIDHKYLNLLERVGILLDVANALDYLHCHGPTPVVHCDLKPSNVLLDAEMVAHLGDFGLAKILVEGNSLLQQSTSSMGFRGTIGYAPPEYGAGNTVSTLGDIYSYGILVLEMVTGKRPIDNKSIQGLNLREYVELGLHGKMMDVVDTQLFLGLENEFHTADDSSCKGRIDCLVSLLRLGLYCSQKMPSNRINGATKATDELALLSIKSMLSSPSSSPLASWNSTSSIHHCSWPGVVCSRRHPGRVAALRMASFNLSGAISPFLANLLIWLNLANNNLSGTIPSSIWNISSSLWGLNIQQNNLVGVVPTDAFTALPELRTISMDNNRFHGRLPTSLVNVSHEIGNLINLEEFHAQSNILSGEIPPSLGECQLLQNVYLQNNFLNGTISSALGQLKGLESLDLSNNKLSGQIPRFLGNISMLSYLNLSFNNFSGEVPDFGVFANITAFLIQGNDKLCGGIPTLHLRPCSSECEALKNLRHRNLVKVITACSSIDTRGYDFKAIVFDFMPNGSLEDWLHPKPVDQTEMKYLGLVQRVTILLDVAYALDYLHCRGPAPVVHCDIKSSNVLLDSDMVAHVGDFGLAKILAEGSSSLQHSTSSMGFRGTIGYAAPEYGAGNIVSTNGDIYSYGILVLETVTGKRPTDNRFRQGLSLREYVEQALHGETMDIVDSQLTLELENECETLQDSSYKRKIDCLISLLRLGVSCSHELPLSRMRTTDIVNELHAMRESLLREYRIEDGSYVNPLLLLGSLLLLAAGTLPLQATTACVPRERDALLAFKRGITSDPLGLLTSWKEDDHDCCRWRGVTCSNLTGHVLRLHLNGGYDLDRFELVGLVGEISPQLLHLDHIKHLDLSINSLEGPSGQIPKFLGSMNSLRYLNLSSIPFTGTVPPQLGNLSNLRYLDLSDMEGGVHLTDISWLPRLGSLKFLNLTYIDLSAASDWPYVMNMIPSLSVLSLSFYRLQRANQSLTHFNLTKLEKLDLSMNYFDHPYASCWFWNLTILKFLDLSQNRLYDQLPIALGDMTSLRVLRISNNDLGSMAPNLLRNLCNLEVLDLDESLSGGNMTELFGSLPQCSSSKLSELKMSYNNINGSLPAGLFRQFPNLVTLDMSINLITGPLPVEIGMLDSLTYLNLRGNNLEGVITEEHFVSLKSLKYIDLSDNQLLKIVVDPGWLAPFTLEEARFASCQMGPRFPSLAPVVTGIIDKLPDWFWTTVSKVKDLVMSNNQISGVFPANMETMAMEYLDIRSNKLSGQIPLLPRNLSALDIHNNSLSGPLPSEFGVNIYMLILSHNHLSGHIPGSFCKMQYLDTIDLANNLFEGDFPQQCFSMKNIKVLLLSNNRFAGTFPAFLEGCTQLQIIDLSRNNFSSKLPKWIGDKKDLVLLRLSYNAFSGVIPDNITNLPNLRQLDLAANSLSGNLPRSFTKLEGMKREDGYNGSGSVPEDGYSSLCVATKRQELYYGPALLDMVSIDLSSNCLIGGIPEQIASLAALKNLNLSRNNLNGKIPYKIGSLQSLESLELSRNNLSGEIPSTLSNLSYLSDLDLSYNNLSGTIPSGSQLGTLYMEHPDMYNGNNGLCGPPLRRNCSGDIEPRQHGYGDDNKAGHVPEPMYLNILERVSILLDVAYALDYLHCHGPAPVIHCDIKSSNVLLDSDMVARVGDFGLARILDEQNSVFQPSTNSILFRGTIGYAAPEYGAGNTVSTQGDIYSYGILVLETVTGKRPSDSKFTQGLSLCESVSLGLHGKVMDIVDNKLCLGIDQHDPETTDDFSSKQKIDCLISLLRLGLSCSQEMPSSRLSTGDIIKELHAIKESLLLEIEDTEK
uniref:non-specific serine/threonine protein kinase n=1 Tax=Oryza meridionalis TaxID=40149 RepID=A0A0E0F6S4_9ORYZ